MLDDEAIDREVIRARQALSGWAAAVADGTVTGDMPAKVAYQRDVLVTLLDEAPERKHPKLHYLIDRCEALAERLKN